MEQLPLGLKNKKPSRNGNPVWANKKTYHWNCNTRRRESKMKKFELTNETKFVLGRTLHRIKALISFGDVQEGELGGFIEKENNLSHDGDAWVYGDAQVYGNAMVYGNAWVCGDARVYGNAMVYGDAWVCGDARVYGNADLLCITKIGSRNGTTTFFKSKLGIEVSCGCFLGTIEQFENKVKETHGDNEHAQAYKLAIDLAKLRIK